ncbi:MAG: hypothetical protein LAO51_04480 [Acidobacteriia bacterium]|nr:hypothetical protein [Terriglobia bacterium]
MDHDFEPRPLGRPSVLLEAVGAFTAAVPNGASFSRIPPLSWPFFADLCASYGATDEWLADGFCVPADVAEAVAVGIETGGIEAVADAQAGYRATRATGVFPTKTWPAGATREYLRPWAVNLLDEGAEECEMVIPDEIVEEYEHLVRAFAKFCRGSGGFYIRF